MPLFNSSYLCFTVYLLKSCSVHGKSCCNYSPKIIPNFFSQYFIQLRKQIKKFFTSLGPMYFQKPWPVLSTALSQRPKIHIHIKQFTLTYLKFFQHFSGYTAIVNYLSTSGGLTSCLFWLSSLSYILSRGLTIRYILRSFKIPRTFQWKLSENDWLPNNLLHSWKSIQDRSRPPGIWKMP